MANASIARMEPKMTQRSLACRNSYSWTGSRCPVAKRSILLASKQKPVDGQNQQENDHAHNCPELLGPAQPVQLHGIAPAHVFGQCHRQVPLVRGSACCPVERFANCRASRRQTATAYRPTWLASSSPGGRRQIG